MFCNVIGFEEFIRANAAEGSSLKTSRSVVDARTGIADAARRQALVGAAPKAMPIWQLEGDEPPARQQASVHLAHEPEASQLIARCRWTDNPGIEEAHARRIGE